MLLAGNRLEVAHRACAVEHPGFALVDQAVHPTVELEVVHRRTSEQDG